MSKSGDKNKVKIIQLDEDYRQAVSGNGINTILLETRIFILKEFQLQQFFFGSYDHESVVINKASEQDDSTSKIKNSEESDLKIKTGLKYPDLAISIRDLLKGFKDQDIAEENINHLNEFRITFNKTVLPFLSPLRIINDEGKKIIHEFKKEVFSQEKNFKMLQKLKSLRLHTPISELFDFIIYLKESSHPLIKNIQILDSDDKLSYSYFSNNDNNKNVLFLDDLLFANTGLIWADKEDDFNIPIFSCIKLRYENNLDILNNEFDKNKKKEGKLFVCYALSQNQCMTKEQAQEIFAIIEKKFDFFPYPTDYSALINSIYANVYKKFPNIKASMHYIEAGKSYDVRYEEWKKLGTRLWFKGIELTSNLYVSQKVIYAKKYGESKHDYREYLESKKEWLWSISLIIDNLWISDKNYGVDLDHTSVIKYIEFALQETLDDEIFEFLKKDLEKKKKFDYDKLYKKDYEFDILIGLLRIGRYIYMLIKKILRKLKDKQDASERFYYIFCKWKSTTDHVLGSDPVNVIASLERHPDVFGIWYAFEENVTSLRFWIIGKKIDEKRLLSATEEFWKTLDKYRLIRHKNIDDTKLSYGLLMYASMKYMFGSEEEKKDVKKEMHDMSRNKELNTTISKMIEHIKKEIHEYGALNQRYAAALESLRQDIEEIK